MILQASIGISSNPEYRYMCRHLSVGGVLGFLNEGSWCALRRERGAMWGDGNSAKFMGKFMGNLWEMRGIHGRYWEHWEKSRFLEVSMRFSNWGEFQNILMILQYPWFSRVLPCRLRTRGYGFLTIDHPIWYCNWIINHADDILIATKFLLKWYIYN